MIDPFKTGVRRVFGAQGEFGGSVRGRRLLSYNDAVAILTGDSAGLAAADRALGGALSLATGGVSDAVLNVLDARGRILRLGRDLTTGLGGSLDAVDRATRTERIAAAHTILVITAFFQALDELELPFQLAELDLTRDEQLRIAQGEGVEGGGPGLLQTLLAGSVPQPAPHLPYEHVLHELEHWFTAAGVRLRQFVAGLLLWERLAPRQRADAHDAFVGGPLRALATERYRELYAQLATDVPEFGFWSGQIEHQATRVSVRRALTGIETALAGLSAPHSPRLVADSLVTGYRAALTRPILSEGQAPAGMCLPTLGEGYVDPDFRVRAVLDGAHGPAEEEWWETAPVRSDITEYLAGVLTTVASTSAPLVVLGQPGAGKSVLTKILAARLPAGGYLPVRIVLREVPADADIQDQIEHALRAATGERASWPELVRAADGAVPVLLFDGFDELLQATGVSQSDYLARVARFQEREADQGRPVFALVTTRTAVADRARYPDGAVALRLEPFSQQQTARWLDLWNRLNEPYLTARGLDPLPAAVAVRHQALASQPLLLLMLALYDGAGNALQRGAGADEPLDEAELYEELLASFAAREVGKSLPDGAERELRERAEQELQRLSLISFGMLNRRRQWITTAEAERDLAALLGRPEPVAEGFRAPLGQGEIALGRFFFVQRAQAIRDEQRLATYEFLHATFGEYLIARLSVQLLHGLLAQRPALTVGRTSVDDDLLYVLLSYGPLSSRQILRFIGARSSQISTDERRRLGELLIMVMGDHRHRTEHRFTDYRPTPRATTSRHAVYCANLVTLTLQITGGVRASELFPQAEKPALVWHRRALLWRAAFTETQWTDFALTLHTRGIWSGERQDRQDLEILPTEVLPPPEPVDVCWLSSRSPGDGDQGGAQGWQRAYPDQIRHKTVVSGGTDDAIVLHAVDPLFQWMAPAVSSFIGTPQGTATSFAHGLLSLWLTSGLGAPEDELIARYEHCLSFMGAWTNLDDVSQHRVLRLILGQLATDAHRLPVDVVCAVLDAPDPWGLDVACQELRAKAALTALELHQDSRLESCARECLDDLAGNASHRLLALMPGSYGSAAAQEAFRIAAVRVLALSDHHHTVVPGEVLAWARGFLDGHSA